MVRDVFCLLKACVAGSDEPSSDTQFKYPKRREDDAERRYANGLRRVANLIAARP